jgi:Tol biopolymer transport system component
VVFALGVSLRYRRHSGIEKLSELNLSGQIVFEISNIVKAGIWKLNLKTLKTEMIAKNSVSVFSKKSKKRKQYLDPNISHDGKFVIYTLNFIGKRSVAVMNSDGSSEIVFIELPDSNIEKPSFSPDKKHVAMISNKRVYISVFPPKKQREIQSVSTNNVSNHHLSWLNNKTILYKDDTGIYNLLNIESAEAKPLIKAENSAISKAGDLLAAYEDGDLKIFYIDKESGEIAQNPQKIISVTIYGKITWSPDGKYILATINANNLFGTNKQIAIIDIEKEEFYHLPKMWKKSLAHDWAE